MLFFRFLSILVFLSGAAAAANSFTVAPLPSPAGDNSSVPNLWTSQDGTVYLTWVEESEGGKARLLLSKLEEDAWMAPALIAEGEDWFVNWADFPSLSGLPDGPLLAHWLVQDESYPLAYDIYAAHSPDGGASWSEPFRLHRDQSPVEHGFVSFFPISGSEIGAVWLDGRKMGESEFTGAMQLRFRTLRDGRISEESVVLDDRVCSCCPTAAAAIPGGAIVAYRDRTEEEVRDISIVRLQEGVWSAPKSVSDDGWQIAGCPVNGPALDARGNEVVLAWPTEAEGRNRVLTAFSRDGGLNFSSPVRVDEGNPLGRVDAVLLQDGSAFISWMEIADDATRILARRVESNGRLGQPLLVADSTQRRSSGFPRMTRFDDYLIVAWTEIGEAVRVQTVRLKWLAPAAVRPPERSSRSEPGRRP